MTLVNAALAVLVVGLSIYAVTAGADFGGGLWDLVAGGPHQGAEVRARIEKSIGPVWEANHVWLIFCLVVAWTCFPPAFAAVASTLYIPSTIAAFGVILRGSGFAFRKEVTRVAYARIFGGAFAISSVVTPFALGTIAGAIASGRVPVGIGQGNVLTSWINPTSLLGGVLAVAVCAYLAAVYLCADCSRSQQTHLADGFRIRGMISAACVVALGLISFPLIASDAPSLHRGLLNHAVILGIACVVAASASVAFLAARRYILARFTAVAAVVGAIWSWGVAQFPDVLANHLSAAAAAAPDVTLRISIIGLSIGAVLVIPSLALLFRIAQSE